MDKIQKSFKSIRFNKLSRDQKKYVRKNAKRQSQVPMLNTLMRRYNKNVVCLLASARMNTECFNKRTKFLRRVRHIIDGLIVELNELHYISFNEDDLEDMVSCTTSYV